MDRVSPLLFINYLQLFCTTRGLCGGASNLSVTSLKYFVDTQTLSVYFTVIEPCLNAYSSLRLVSDFGVPLTLRSPWHFNDRFGHFAAILGVHRGICNFWLHNTRGLTCVCGALYISCLTFLLYATYVWLLRATCSSLVRAICSHSTALITFGDALSLYCCLFIVIVSRLTLCLTARLAGDCGFPHTPRPQWPASYRFLRFAATLSIIVSSCILRSSLNHYLT